MDLKVLHKISYGLYIASALQGEKCNGCIVNTVFQVTSKPATIAVSINKDNYTHRYIEESGVFGVSILSQDTPMEFIGRFGFKSGKDTDKFAGINYKMIKGVPVVLDHALAYIVARVINVVDAGTHAVIIGEVIDVESTGEGAPLTYAYYHAVKKGVSPRNAPTYLPDMEKPAEQGTSGDYRCTVCGYVYEQEQGDPGNGVEPGTPFEKLPEGWVCPVCGAPKSKFVKV